MPPVPLYCLLHAAFMMNNTITYEICVNNLSGNSYISIDVASLYKLHTSLVSPAAHYSKKRTFVKKKETCIWPFMGTLRTAVKLSKWREIS